MALCLTAFTAGSARSDSWFSGWGKKKAAADGEDAQAPGTGLVTDENPVEDSDEISDEEPADDVGHHHRCRLHGDNYQADCNECRLHAIDKINTKYAEFKMLKAEHQARATARRFNRAERRDARLNSMGIYDYTTRPIPQCYPQLNSSLYPCPRLDIPQEVGSTMITNQAFYPHEMLYAHQYRAIYPPFYYENKCGITCLPFIPRPCVAGTVVSVKYKTCLPCSFHPPLTVCGGSYKYPWSAAGQATFCP